MTELGHSHVPIMADRILGMMLEQKPAPETHLDGTFGRGGHLGRVLEAFPSLQAVAIDKDLEAISYGRRAFAGEIEKGRVFFVHADFHELAELIQSGAIPIGEFDSILFDLGVSSPQFDQADRGFSFQHEGPLDMRMNQSQNLTAAHIVNEWPEDDLVRVFREYGEVEKPMRVVRAIVHDRKETPFRTTRDLSGLIERVEGWVKKGHHPATRYFMALRIQVNGELEGLAEAVETAIRFLKTGGRLYVITFHSLEDRVVKQTFLGLAGLGKTVTRQVIKPEEEEVAENSRARSAKLRVFERVDGGFERKKRDKYAHRKGH